MNIILGAQFLKDMDRLHKRYRSISADVKKVSAEIEVNTQLGTSLGKSCRKIRMAIASKGKGKSGGAGVIVYVHIVDDMAVLLTIYDKSDKENLDAGELQALLSASGLE